MDREVGPAIRRARARLESDFAAGRPKPDAEVKEAARLWLLLLVARRAAAGENGANALLEAGPAAHEERCRRALSSAAKDAPDIFGDPGAASRLVPSPGALRDVSREIAPPGFSDPTALGWAYCAGSAPGENGGLRTRLYTPAWITRFLVENTLGRLWLEIHPDSRLAPSMTALVARPARRADPRLAREIRFLDPACGTMNFGLAAFELLHAIYAEEIGRAGEAGWPATPSVPDPSDAPASILARNIRGLDVDGRAVEIARLALRIAARRRSPGARLEEDGLSVVAPPLGSLGLPAAAEFDVVATNPPYVDLREYPFDLRRAIDERLPESKRNLYAAFLADSLRRLRPGGRLGFVTPQSFLFVSSFEKLRREIRATAAVETVVQTGLHTFPDAVVDCALTILRSEPGAAARGGEPGTFVRLVREESPEKKRAGLASAVAAIARGRRTRAVFSVPAREFDAVPRGPFVYWAPPRVRALFREKPPLQSLATPRQGLATTDNERFVRCHWEVDPRSIARGCASRADAKSSGKKWFPYMKGGGFRRFFGSQEFVVDWEDDGAGIKKAIADAYPYLGGKWEWVAKNADFYFRPGVTYSYLTSGRFSARLSPPGFIFDVAGSTLFPTGGERARLHLLGLLNSSVVAYLLGLVNPTVNFQVGDLKRIPVPERTSARLVRLVEEAVDLARETDSETETSPGFRSPPSSAAGVAARASRMERIERAIDGEAFRLYGISARDRRAIEAEVRPGGSADEIWHEAEVALRRVSYAVGVVVGRFGAATAALRGVVTPGGLLDADDLSDRALRALEMLEGGPDAAARTVAQATAERAGSDPRVALERHLVRGFFERHAREHRRRPPLFLLASPRREGLALYVRHEKADERALARVARDLVPRRRRRLADSGASPRVLADLDAFAARLEDATVSLSRPRRDDGIRARLAALAGLVPAAAAAAGRQTSSEKTCCVFESRNPARS